MSKQIKENDTFDGILSLLTKNEADMYYKPGVFNGSVRLNSPLFSVFNLKNIFFSKSDQPNILRILDFSISVRHLLL